MPSFGLYPDGRPSRACRLPKVTLPGGGYISKGEDGRLAVAGRESLRILRLSAPKIESTRNLWEGSGLKIDCASTDVAWAYGVFNNKILTSARNGELIMWDVAKTGHSKFERRTKEHLRSIHAMSVSPVIHHYCMTGSADGDFRVWDLRDIQSSVMRVHNTSAVRRVIFSPCLWNPLFVLIGMDNGTLHRWDLKMGQRGLLDRLPVAHTAPITTIDWYSGGEEASHAISFQSSGSQSASSGGPDDYTGNTLGWVASAGLDRCVKIWDLTGPDAASHMPNKPTYALHPSYPIRRILWRPGYECELAVVSHADFTVSSHVDHLNSASPVPGSSSPQSRASSGLGLDSVLRSFSDLKLTPANAAKESPGTRRIPSSSSNLNLNQLSEQLTNNANANQRPVLDTVEIWDVRRSWLPKWSVSGTSAEGGVTDIEFVDPYALVAQNTNGTFTQLDMRDTSKPLDAISRTATSWTPEDGLAFVTDDAPSWEVPYDDINPLRLMQEPPPPLLKAPVIKHIGDKPFRPKTQKLGAFAPPQAQLESDAFKRLAATYVIEGEDKASLCMYNMQAAADVGKQDIAQIWLVMATALTDLKHVPPEDTLPTPPQSPPQCVASLGSLSATKPQPQPSITHTPLTSHTHTSTSVTPASATASATSTLTAYPFSPTSANSTTPNIPSASRSPEVSRPRQSPSYPFPPPTPTSTTNHNNSSPIGRLPGYKSPSTSKRPTPVSSNSSSPLHLSTALPPIHTHTHTHAHHGGGGPLNSLINIPHRASFLSRRESLDSGLSSSIAAGAGAPRRSSTGANTGTGPSTPTGAGGPSTSTLLRRKSISAARAIHTHGSTTPQSQSQFQPHSHAHTHSASPVEKTRVKMAGEGVLSDSDSDPETDDECSFDEEDEEDEEIHDEEEDEGGDELRGEEDEDEEDEEEEETVGVASINSDNGGQILSEGMVLSPLARFRAKQERDRERENERFWTSTNTRLGLGLGGKGRGVVEEEEEEEHEEYAEYDSSSPGSPDSSSSSQSSSDDNHTAVLQHTTTPILNLRKATRSSLRSSKTGGTGKNRRKRKQRSRSSTLASLPANASGAGAATMIATAPTLSLKHGIQSSTRTITVVETPAQIEPVIPAAAKDEAAQTSLTRHRSSGKKRHHHHHHHLRHHRDHHPHQHEEHVHLNDVIALEKVSKRKQDIVEREESKMVGYVWEMLKEAFGELLVVGDVQTAATMAVIVPKELGVSMRRRMHVVDAYLEKLFRCRLYTAAAYFRKHSGVRETKNMTLIETTIYATCGKCKKPLVKPTGHSLDNSKKFATFSYCLGCKAPTVRCTICRLPVRNMVFQCSICQHGGHQSCYRQFYLNQPMVNIPSIQVGEQGQEQQRGRSQSEPGLDTPELNAAMKAEGGGGQIGIGRELTLKGHPCAAGCGHYCWATAK